VISLKVGFDWPPRELLEAQRTFEAIDVRREPCAERIGIEAQALIDRPRSFERGEILRRLWLLFVAHCHCLLRGGFGRGWSRRHRRCVCAPGSA